MEPICITHPEEEKKEVTSTNTLSYANCSMTSDLGIKTEAADIHVSSEVNTAEVTEHRWVTFNSFDSISGLKQF